NVVASLAHENGGVSTILYTACGARSFSKERIELFGGGNVGVIDDFRTAEVVRDGKTHRKRGWTADKGHAAMLDAFFAACRGEGAERMRQWSAGWLDATEATLVAGRALETGAVERVGNERAHVGGRDK